MKGFIASWFFPPVLSAEGLVTFKLLKNSRNYYDVCSSLSQQWSYKKEAALQSDNINTYYVNTDSIDEWVKQCISIFEMHYKEKKYDFIMTRSMPPESLRIGLEIKRKYPQIKWIASFADPIGKNPYELKAYILDNPKIFKSLKRLIIYHPQKIIPFLKYYPGKELTLLSKLLHLENTAFSIADLYIFPSMDQCLYMLGMHRFENQKNKCLIIPHSFDKELYPVPVSPQNKQLSLTYIGYADNLRSPKNLIKAVNLIREFNEPLLEKFHLNFIGNIPEDIKNMVYAYFLQDTITISSAVPYIQSLDIMQEADWLIHIDAQFSFIPNGSIFFASKIADYIGANKPILGLTTSNSTAAKIINSVGGINASSENPIEIAKQIIKIICDGKITLNQYEFEKYNATETAKIFDNALCTWKGNIEEVVI